VIVPNCIVTLELCPVVDGVVTVSVFVLPSSVTDIVYSDDAVCTTNAWDDPVPVPVYVSDPFVTLMVEPLGAVTLIV